MSINAKQYISGSICALCAAGLVTCISRIIPFGLSGNAAKVKLWFWPIIGCFAIGCVSGVLYYYFRAKACTINPYEIESQTLGKSAQQLHDNRDKKDN